MDHFFDIEGSVTYRSYNGYITVNFSYMSKLYLRTTRNTGAGRYHIDVVSKGTYRWAEEYCTAIEINGKQYHFKDIHENFNKIRILLEQDKIGDMIETNLP